MDTIKGIALIGTFIGVLILTGIGYAADKITLACSGTRSIASSYKTPINTSLVIDLDKGMVAGDIGLTASPSGSFSITQLTENHIEFKAENEQAGMEGKLDRITGSLSVTGSRYEVGVIYDLTCKPAKLLF